MTGLSLYDTMRLYCECGGEYDSYEDEIFCEECGKPLDKEILGELSTLGALQHIGLDPQQVESIRYTTNRSNEPRLIFTMRNAERLTLCKVLKEEHLQLNKEAER